jgi:hypothetical protein
MSVKVPSDLVLMEGERPYWYGRRSLKSILIPFILGLILLLFGAIPIVGIVFIIIAIVIILRSVLACEH